MLKRYTLPLFACALLLAACGQEEEKQAKPQTYQAPLQELNKKQYPDDPALHSAHEQFGVFDYQAIVFEEFAPDSVCLTFLPAMGDTIITKALNLKSWVPTVPEVYKANDYLYRSALQSQEWTRLQVALPPTLFSQKNSGKMPEITRLDLVRNQLGAGLWEAMFYNNAKGHDQLVYHAWFTFPPAEYQRLFELSNDTAFEAFEPMLTTWTDLPQEHIAINLIRRLDKDDVVAAEVKNDDMYQLKGEFRHKFRNILFPTKPQSLHDFHSDSTAFARFTEPGKYTKSQPFTGELGRFQQLQQVKLHEVTSQVNQEALAEIELWFMDQAQRETYLVIGGVDLKKIPTLALDSYHKALPLCLGFANPYYHVGYEELQKDLPAENPRYLFLADKDGKYLNAKKVGLSGALLHFEEGDSQKLHLYLTSYEHHAIVGHFVLTLPENLL